MASRFSALLSAASVAFCILCLPKVATASSELVTFQVQLKRTRLQNTPAEVAKNTLNTKEGRLAAEAVATYFGAPEGTVSAITEALNSQFREKGNGGWIGVAMPDGYEFCNAKVAKWSSNIGNGDLSVGGFNAGANPGWPDHLYVYSSLQKKNQGRSSFKVLLDVVAVKAGSRSKFKCLPYKSMIVHTHWKDSGPSHLKGLRRRTWDDKSEIWPGGYTKLPDYSR